MAGDLGLDSATSMVPSCFRGLPILLVDHDMTTVTSLSSMLQLFSYDVTKVGLARRAVSMIEEEPKRFKLIIANIEMPDIDTDSFLHSLLHKNIPLILISSEMPTTKASEYLNRGACLCLEKPVSKTDIKYLWQHAIDKKDRDSMMQANDEKDKSLSNPIEVKNPQTHHSSADPKGKRVMVQENIVKSGYLEEGQIEAFRKVVRMQRSGQSSLLRKRPLNREIPRYESYEKRRNLGDEVAKMANDDEEIKKEEESDENKAHEARKRGNVWNAELHMKFTAALCALGEKNARPKSILQIMNVPNLTQRQVASHLQKFKAQVQRLSETMPRIEWTPTKKTFKYPSNYEYPFKASNLTQNLIASNSSWYPLAMRASNSSRNKRKTAKGKLEFCLGGKVNLNKLPLFTEMMNNKPAFRFCSVPQDTSGSVPPMSLDPNISVPCDLTSLSRSYSPCYVPEIDTNQTSLVPETGLEHMGLQDYYVPSLDDFQSSGCVLDSDLSQMGFDPAAATLCNPSTYSSPGDSVLGTNVNQMGFVPCGESYLSPSDLIPGLVTCEESYLPPGNMMPPETYANQMGYVPNLEDIFPDSATSYLPDSAFTPMDSAPSVAQNVMDGSQTHAEGSGSPHQSLADISEFLNMSDLEDNEGVSLVDGIGDIDGFFSVIDKYLKEGDTT